MTSFQLEAASILYLSYSTPGEEKQAINNLLTILRHLQPKPQNYYDVIQGRDSCNVGEALEPPAARLQYPTECREGQDPPLPMGNISAVHNSQTTHAWPSDCPENNYQNRERKHAKRAQLPTGAGLVLYG